MLMSQAEESGLLAAPRPLEGRAAIVTGSTSGIGLGIARALAGAGARVMLNGLGDAVEIEKLGAVLGASSTACWRMSVSASKASARPAPGR